MANTKTGKKQILVSKRNRMQNVAVQTRLKHALKAARTAIASGDKADADKKVRAAIGQLFKTRTKGVIHKNNASRHASRLMSLYNKTFGEAKPAAVIPPSPEATA